MEERKTLQLYKLEGELERLEFEHKNACKADEAIERRIQNFRFSIRLAVSYSIISLLFFVLAPYLVLLGGGEDLLTFVYPFILIIFMGLIILSAGAFYHAFSKKGRYYHLKKKKMQTEQAVLEAGKQLSKINLQVDTLREEIVYEEKQEDIKENPETTEVVESENQNRLKEMLLLQEARKEKAHKELLRDLENIQLEEMKNEKWMKIYGVQTILSIALLALLIILRTISIHIFPKVFTEVIILFMPWVAIFPSSIMWLSKYLNRFWGEDLWINRVLFSGIHEYSISARKNQILVEIERLEKELEENRLKQRKCSAGSEW